MAKGAGKRRGSRKASKKQVRLHPSMLLYAAGLTFCVIAWGYLVSAAIDFGSTARSGRSEAWLFLAVACVGAACCLFAGLMFGARLLRGLGITNQPQPSETGASPGPVAESPYTPQTHAPHGSHSSHGSHGAHTLSGSRGHVPTPTAAPTSSPTSSPTASPTASPRHPGGHRRPHG